MAKVEEQPKCPICLDVYKDPRILRCFHVYCLRCLMQLVDRDKHGRLSLPCPTCRHVTPIPAKGVAGLQPLLYISHQLAVVGRKEEGRDVVELGGAAQKMERELKSEAGRWGSGGVNLVPLGDITLYCSVHPDRGLKLFCETCGRLVCSKCSSEDSHKGHCCIVLNEVRGRQCENGPASEVPAVGSVECSIVSELIGSKAKGFVERRGQGQYHVTYQPTVKGGHQLHVMVAGKHVPGSPFSMAIKSPVETLSTPMRTLGKVQRPWGVALARTGEIVVTEYSGHKVSVLTHRGERRCSFGGSGSGPGQFDHPCEVAVDGAGNILVADSWNHRVQKFSADGRFMKQASSVFNCPIGIAYSAFNDSVYVVDGSNKVHVLNSDLDCRHRFGGEGNKEGLFNTPWSVACDVTGKVYVADSYNNRVQVFSAEGDFLWLFGRRGTGRGELGWPAGVAVDADGMVYVSEGDNCRVSVFSPRGQFVTSFGRKGEGPGGFGAVRGVAVDNSGVVYVCDRDNQFLHMF